MQVRNSHGRNMIHDVTLKLDSVIGMINLFDVCTTEIWRREAVAAVLRSRIRCPPRMAGELLYLWIFWG